MPRLSAIIPHRGATDDLLRQAPRVAEGLRGLGRPFEIILVEDGPPNEDDAWRQALQVAVPGLRLLGLDRPSGLSAALSAGIAAARGEIIVAIEAGEQYRPEQIAWLVERLSRADLVCGRRQRPRWSKTWLAVAQLPRRLLLGLEARDPDCLFWAARREAVERLTLTAGMHRFVAPLVAARGYRVSEIYVDHREVPSSRNGGLPLAAGNLLCAWWQRRQMRPCEAREESAQLSDSVRPPRMAA